MRSTWTTLQLPSDSNASNKNKFILRIPSWNSSFAARQNSERVAMYSGIESSIAKSGKLSVSINYRSFWKESCLALLLPEYKDKCIWMSRLKLKKKYMKSSATLEICRSVRYLCIDLGCKGQDQIFLQMVYIHWGKKSNQNDEKQRNIRSEKSKNIPALLNQV